MNDELESMLDGVSGYDCARALLLVGFRLVGTTAGQALLERDGVGVLVPQLAEIPRERLSSILARAGVLPVTFAVLLGRLGSRDTFPEGLVKKPESA